ncbi:alpha/beta hydrolase [Planctomyces sp. SH-PL14]|uniref:alpha/beta hydrolase n=1 Tax=Planctomyces sp. SH-PL14 TaxID=1632864 RepID=UPI00078CA932|nr:alpha/beta hydrolase-fold protein [Planctomyces sp. SH-PL14]AMV20464.1 Ferri-bacillibactin esterase BesA [Planctomyces sp. SH-PL14]
MPVLSLSRAFALTATLAGLLGAWPAIAEEPLPTVAVSLPRTEQFDVTSRKDLTYRIFVSLPNGKPKEAGAPVVYLTDANADFPVVAAAARRLSQGDPVGAIVVGIGYPEADPRIHQDRRYYDLVGPASEEFLKTLPGGGAGRKTGGNDQFLAFIEEELKPRIESRYQIDRTRQTLFGHSFGGLFTLHALFTRPEAFQNYVASSPSIWWFHEAILDEERSFLERQRKQPAPARLMITGGAWEETPPPNADPARIAMLKPRKMVSNARAMTERLSSAQVEGLSVLFREFPEEDHGSVLLPAASRGMRFALDRSK